MVLLSKLSDGWDNDDVRIRPSRSSRPRTKTRPTHEDAAAGFVVTVDRGRYTCLVGSTSAARIVMAMRAKELGRRAVAVGDRVAIVGDITGATDTLARIVRIEKRTSVLRRSADDDTETVEKVLVANADQLVIVVAAADPLPRTGFIDRCLVAAYTGDLQPVLVVTKTDLADPQALLDLYADLELPVLVSKRKDSADASQGAILNDRLVEEVRELLNEKESVLVGHSGVGKSTLVNALVPHAYRAIGVVSGVGKGRHTSTSAIALALPDGGWVIDTPGVRSFGLAHVTPDDLLRTFDDLNEASVDCPPNCDHQGLPCALDAAVLAGAADRRRLASFRRLLSSRSGAASDESAPDQSAEPDQGAAPEHPTDPGTSAG